jgi:TolB protein
VYISHNSVLKSNLMKNFTLVLYLMIGFVVSAAAQWSNRYPKVDGYGHHVYLEGHELPVLNAGPMDPAPSPDGTEVVFSAKGWLWIMGLDDLVAKRLTSSSGMDSRPNWSPDGKFIVFVRDDGQDLDIFMVDRASGKEEILVNTEAIDMDPAFSSDGSSIYYSSALSGSMDIWRLSLADREHQRITTDDSQEFSPVVVGQKKLLAYIKKYGFSYDSVNLLNLDDNKSSILVEENFTSQAAIAMLPDHQTLAYTWPNGDDYELRLLDISMPGSTILLTRGEGLPLAPEASMDGRWIYYAECNRNERSELKRISVQGGTPEILTPISWDYGSATSRLKIISKVDGEISPVRISISHSSGHPIIPEEGRVHSEGENGLVFFYSPGVVEVQAPKGRIEITAVQGFSTEKEVRVVELKDPSAEVEIELNRIWAPRESGWYSGDLHFHLNYGGTYRLDPDDISLDLLGEDLDVAYPLLANLGNRFLEQDLWGWQNKGNPIIRFGQEVRSHFLGHLGLIGTANLFWPWVWGPGYDIYGGDDRLNAEVLEFARGSGGLGCYVHPVSIRSPFAEGGARRIPVSLIADGVLGHIDLIELACLWTDEIGTGSLWHHLLNIGAPIAISAGSDVMNDLYRTMAIGATRVYVKLDGSLTEHNYLQNLKAGKSFVTNGPLIEFKVGGKHAGEVVNTHSKSVDWELEVHSAMPYDLIEVFVNGESIWSQEIVDYEPNRRVHGTIDIPEGGWITARVHGGESEWPMMDSYPFAETGPIWFDEIGSIHPQSAKLSAAELLSALEVSESRLKEGYHDRPIPVLLDHFQKARLKLQKLAAIE